MKIRVTLLYQNVSQKFFYKSPYQNRNVTDGLRQDLRKWCEDCVGPERTTWRYGLEEDGVAFYFPTKGYAALFILTWKGIDSIYNDEPVHRPGGDIGI